MKLLILMTLLGLICNAIAGTISLPPAAQAKFRQAVYANYSKQKTEGGYYDVIKHGVQPVLRILDCQGDLCLLDVVTSPDAPGFDSSLHQVIIRDHKLVGDMQGVAVYGRAIRQAAFLTPSPCKNASADTIYVESQTHMGTRAEQILDLDSHKSIALQTSYKNKVHEKEGDVACLVKARQALRALGPPIEF